MDPSPIVARAAADIEKFGWHCLTVAPRQGEQGSGFTYTIGLQATFGHPELMIFDLAGATAHGILSDCVDRIRAGRVFAPAVRYDDVVGGGYVVELRKVRTHCLADYFGAARGYYGERRFDGMILFWPDREQRFPWDADNHAAQREALGLID